MYISDVFQHRGSNSGTQQTDVIYIDTGGVFSPARILEKPHVYFRCVSTQWH